MSAEERFQVVVERRIKASPAEVFPYLIEPERFTKWMRTDADLDVRPGGKFRIMVPGGSTAIGEYLIVEPPELLVYTWGWENDVTAPPGSSTVEISLRADGEETVVVLSHGGLPGGPMASAHTQGWSRYLDRLVITATGGYAGPDEKMEDTDAG